MRDERIAVDNVAAMASDLSGRVHELATELVQLYGRELPHLVNDDESVVSLLSASLYQNIDTALRIFQHDIDPARVEAPAAALEYARRLAQRGIPVIDLLRSYYLGQTAILDHALRTATRRVDDTELLGAMMSRTLTVTFAFIDRVTQQVVSAYQEERDRWLLSRSAVRIARVRALLQGGGVDLDGAEAALGYRLRGTHLAMVLWHTAEPVSGNALPSLETLAGEISENLPSTGLPLFVPVDALSAWVWIPLERPALPGEAHVRKLLAAAEPHVRLAIGEPAQGVEGFRSSHRQAQRVHQLVDAAGEHADRMLTFRDVGAIALMAADLPAARMWVSDTLGLLATDDEHHARLRETLRVFLSAGCSYTAAAGLLTMHKNSVQYRVRKAEETIGRPVADNRLDVELALKLCRRLGPAVLTAS